VCLSPWESPIDSKQRSNPDSLGFEAIDPWKSEYLAVKRALVAHPDSYEWLFIKSITG
jgi:hypothetical protein